MGVGHPFAYLVGGFVVRSSFALPLLPPAPSTPADGNQPIVLDRADGPVPADGAVAFRWPGRYGLTLRRHGEGRVLETTHVAAEISPDGRSVRCHFSSPGGPQVLVRRILPRLAQWHGRIALHAAAVGDGDSAILLLGGSGAGKSTLAVALSATGPWRLMSDDITLVDADPAPPQAWPSGAGACLWPDSLAAFSAAPDACSSVAGHDEKRWLDVAPAHAAPRRVAALVALGPDAGEVPTLDRVTPTDAARLVGPRMMSFDPSDPALMARSWRSLGRLVAQAAAFTLSYPRQYERLAAAASVLTDALREGTLAPT